MLLALSFLQVSPASAETAGLTFEDRVACLEKVERVLWRHRLWPEQNPGPRPPFERTVDRQALAIRTERLLAEDDRYATSRGRGFSAGELQEELDRIAATTQAPEVLAEIFAALADDPYLAAECVARPSLLGANPRQPSWPEGPGSTREPRGAEAIRSAALRLPEVVTTPCTVDVWSPIAATPTPASDGRYGSVVVWTGAEAIVWGGNFETTYSNVGLKYVPALNSWTYTSTVSAPVGRRDFAYAWTGTELIVWGGSAGASPYLNSGGRYNPAANSWQSTNAAGAPTGRALLPGVWTGTEFIVWGGNTGSALLSDGGRYNPASNSWISIPSSGAPTARWRHVGVWTGTGALFWSGDSGGGGLTNTGGIFDPGSGTWAATTLTGVPSARAEASMAHTGDEAVAWGGSSGTQVNTGGILADGAASWAATAAAGVPLARTRFCLAWTGLEVVVWGGLTGSGPTNTGGRLDPEANLSWTSTSTTGTLSARYVPACAWIGDRLLVWGGYHNGGPTFFSDGATYCAPSDFEVPGNPTSFAADLPHGEGAWVSDPDLVMTWSGATDSGGAGLDGYAFLIDQQPSTDPGSGPIVPQGTDPHSSGGTLADGQWYAHLRACDEAGNCAGALHRGPYGIDTVPPAAPTGISSSSHVAGTPSDDSTVDVTWTAAVDATSGIAGYAWDFTAADSWSCDEGLDGTSATASSSALTSGSWWFHVCAVDQAGNWGPVASAGPFVLDLEGAQVVSVGSVADSGDGMLTAGEQLTDGPTQVLVRFDEPMNLSSAETVSNYWLVEAGPDRDVDSVSCSGGLLDDDQALNLAWSVYGASPPTAAVGLAGRVPAPKGNYRFFACATLEDVAGNPLNGDGLPGDGEDRSLDFSVQASNLLLNPNFDGDLGFWASGATAGSPFVYAPQDADGAASSGVASLAATPVGADTAYLEQCFALQGSTRLRLAGTVAVSGGEADVSPGLGLVLEAFDQPGCSGSSLGTLGIPLWTGPTPAGGWLAFQKSASLAASTLSARLRANVTAGAPAPYAVRFDSLAVDDGSLFADNFESGNGQRWSVRFPPF